MPLPAEGEKAMEEKGKMRGYEEKNSIRDDTFPGSLETDVETGSPPLRGVAW